MTKTNPPTLDKELLAALRNITVLAQNMRDALETGAPVENIPNAYFNAAYKAIERAEADKTVEISQLAWNDMLGMLKNVRETCLFDDDDEAIGVTTDPHIDNRLFDKICGAIAKAEKIVQERTP